ncbi:Membrane alanine aminopeptidase N, partial [hydrothermal vent metagenome]
MKTTMNKPKTTFLHNYQPPPFTIDKVNLHFNLEEEHTTVSAELSLRRCSGSRDLILNGGPDLKLLNIALDERPLTLEEYCLESSRLIIKNPPQEFILQTTVRIKPHENTTLEGLYRSSSIFCSQCEAEGFRKITYFLDRPDIMSVYTTTIEAHSGLYPVLLSNGNLIEKGSLDNGRHFARWHDPFPKPCYIFALVAGDLAVLTDSFTTKSGRPVELRIYSEHHNADKCAHAMRALQKAMAWDEKRFNLEYDLDLYMIVAVDDFNAGAMENKGLNIFNSKYVLARPQTATDQDYEGIESVVGHEYFHNWTGDRVTCRDWFQLSLKEGLTVFRDQEFTADSSSRAIKRISDVTALRNLQFPEDAGPMAHPVRPASYVEINNFYTLTVYEKGAEVIRMLHTMLGEETFQAGMRIYIARHDGQAVTTEDFVQAMEDAWNQSAAAPGPAGLEQFKVWYEQAGTPRLYINSSHDQAAGTFTLKVRQEPGPTAGSAARLNHIPLRLALLDRQGKELNLKLKDKEYPASGMTLHIKKAA